MSNIDTALQKLPNTPGVYYFLGGKKKEGKRVKGREVLYVGKTASLKSRVQSYFRDDVASARGPAIVKMASDASDISFEETDSVLEAFILEARRIKEYAPKYNVRDKDDKSFNYIVITDEDFPRVLVVRYRDIVKEKFTAPMKELFGPFPHSGSLREALSLIRKIFPFRDSACTPGQGKPCFNRHIGLCPGVCTGEITKKEYRRQIKNIALFLSGRKRALLSSLQREMNTAARNKEFEHAARMRDQLHALEHIQDVALLKHEKTADASARRIEAYDVAHISGTNTVGVFAVVADGEPQPSEYRTFKIREKTGGSDTAALAELITRRLEHDEWTLPFLFVADGGEAQMRVLKRALREYGYEIPVVGVVKDEHHRPKRIAGEDRNLITEFEREILLANNEAHRFALKFHRKRRQAAQK